MAGMQIESQLEEIGVLIGSIDEDQLCMLKSLPGVVVEDDRDILPSLKGLGF